MDACSADSISILIIPSSTSTDNSDSIQVLELSTTQFLVMKRLVLIALLGAALAVQQGAAVETTRTKVNSGRGFTTTLF